MDQLSVRPGICEVVRQDVAGMLDIQVGIADDVPPVYQPIRRSLSPSMSSDAPTLALDVELPSNLPSTLSRSRSFLQMEVHEAFTYTYNLFVGGTRVQVIILVEPDQEFDRPNHYVFSLSVKTGSVERAIAKPVTMKLTIDPGGLDFVVFAFAPRACLPSGCLYHLRVWLRSAGIDHRVFSERDLWFGRDPDFRSITDASFASLRKATKDVSIYHGTVGRAHVNFILRWTPIEPCMYALAFEYEAGGVGKTLFENYYLRLDCEPRALSFFIYSIPVPSTPVGASHRLRLWLRTPYEDGSDGPSYLYQRLWKSDDFKVGAQLRFEASHRLILATRAVDVEPAPSAHGPGGLGLGLNLMPLASSRRRMSRLIPGANVDQSQESVDDL